MAKNLILAVSFGFKLNSNLKVFDLHDKKICISRHMKRFLRIEIGVTGLFLYLHGFASEQYASMILINLL